MKKDFDYRANRQKLLDWIRKQLVGVEHLPNEVEPINGDSLDIVGISPLDLYPCGVLYPLTGSIEESVEDDVDEDNMAQSRIMPETTYRYVPPSAVSFSFFMPTKKWKIRVWASARRYEEISQVGKKKSYKNKFLLMDREIVTSTAIRDNHLFIGQDGISRAGISVETRPHKQGEIITVSLFNHQIVKNDEKDTSQQVKNWLKDRLEKCLFGTRLHCFIEDGDVGDYPLTEYSLLDHEEQELTLLYRHKKVYAIGHGASVQWKTTVSNENIEKVREIYTDFMPVIEVPQVTADTLNQNSPVLNIAFLAQFTEQPEVVLQALHQFIESYQQWFSTQKDLVLELEEMQDAGNRIIERIHIAIERMRSGLLLLKNSPHVAQAFALANQAMLLQMQQQLSIKSSPIDVNKINWRPFQLAFILTTLASAVDEDDDYRDTLDLIWFPTGGGKTEAYLGLMALVIIWRRLQFPHSAGGTTVLMRYTLRLLTTQQYVRASKLICALEILRQQHPELGSEPITIGLWVGNATTPNTFQEAAKKVHDLQQGDKQAIHQFVLQDCPWCGTPFNIDFQQNPVNNLIAIHSDKAILGQNDFYFRCLNQNCHFGHTQQKLPCQVVDEALYYQPPTLLVGTIDKFARLPKEERANSFFGQNGNRPPELIIQDELHLISAEIGSIAGIYEAAIETIINHKGVYPKYIASTATIRNAEIQVQRLYGKEVRIFPPSGLNAEDAYFAKTVPLEERAGRCYVGYFAPMLNRKKNLAPLSANLLLAPEILFSQEQDQQALQEAWWTQIIYHGSLKGVSNSHNAFDSDIYRFYQLLTTRITECQKTREYSPHFDREYPKLEQLTSNNSAAKNIATFAQLTQKKGEEGCIDALLATNMIAVGLDVARLALMIINGQPLTTAEYIQASSRVGRSTVPGIVFVNYYRDQARSLSHYENFRAYHDSFYRFVEPTSVTPFTYQARKRALAAALVMSIRHSTDLLSNKSAVNFSLKNPEIQKIIQRLGTRCVFADKDRGQSSKQHLQQLAQEWEEYCQLIKENRQQLFYYQSQQDITIKNLLASYEEGQYGKWKILDSMRTVEKSGLLELEDE